MREDADGANRARTDGFGDGGAAGVAALRALPDQLVPSLPAVLQSSARLESSGMVGLPPFGAPPPSGGAVPIGASSATAAALASAPERHKAILGLKHLHGLDGLDEGKGRKNRNTQDEDD
jgi:hypothetical protein